MYATLDDIKMRIGADAFALLCSDGGEKAPLNKALEDATAEIEAHVGARHEVPLDPVPKIARVLAVDIAVYRASSDAGRLTDQRRQRYEDAVRLLKGIASGEASLGIADPDPPAAAERPAVLAESPPRHFGRDSARGML